MDTSEDKTSTSYSKRRRKESTADWYEVTMILEFTRTVQILADDKDEAGEIAENRARRSRCVARLGYSLGDIEIIEAKPLSNFSHGNVKYTKGVAKQK